MTKYRLVYRTILLSVLVASTGYRDAAGALPPAYRVTDLGTLGGTESYGWSINASGQVAGYSYTAENAESHAFLWTPTTPNGISGTMLDLGTLGGTSSRAFGINASGQVTGQSYTAGDAERHAFLHDGTMRDLGTLKDHSSGSDVNASGHVVGQTTLLQDGTFEHAFLYDGAIHDLGTLGGSLSDGRGVNDNGQVTGVSDTTGDMARRAFLWTPAAPGGMSGTMIDLGTLGGRDSLGEGVNASGQVTGVSLTLENAAEHAFLWTPTMPNAASGTMHDLGTLGGTLSIGRDVNNSGHVAGVSNTAGDAAAHAFLYTSDSGMVDLNAFIHPLTGWELNEATGINEAGQIVGIGLIGGQSHAFLLTPVPEPATLALLSIALPFLNWRRSRRSRADETVAPAISVLRPLPASSLWRAGING